MPDPAHFDPETTLPLAGAARVFATSVALGEYLDSLAAHLAPGPDPKTCILDLRGTALQIQGWDPEDLALGGGNSREDADREAVRRCLALALWIDELLTKRSSDRTPLEEAARCFVLLTSEMDFQVDDAVFRGELRTGRALVRVKEQIASLGLRLRTALVERQKEEQEAAQKALLREVQAAPARPAEVVPMRPRKERAKATPGPANLAQPWIEAVEDPRRSPWIPVLVLLAAGMLIARIFLGISLQPRRPAPAIPQSLAAGVEGVAELQGFGPLLVGRTDAAWDTLDREQALRRLDAIGLSAKATGFEAVCLVDDRGIERARWADGRAPILRDRARREETGTLLRTR